MLSAHYRNPINFSHDLLVQAQSGLNRIYTCIDNLEFLKGTNEGKTDNSAFDGLDKFKDEFISAMDDDVNTADAISAIFDLVRFANSEINGETTLKPLTKRFRLSANWAVFWAFCRTKKTKFSTKKLKNL